MKDQIIIPGKGISPEKIFEIIDQIFDIERKVEMINEPNSIQRNINRLKESFGNIFTRSNEFDIGYIYENPLGESYDATRINVEANITGESTENLVITEVIKPIIRYKNLSIQDGPKINSVVRPGVVVVESKKNMEDKKNE
jgi:hypothetical protein